MLWGRMDDADCIAVRISETKVLVPGCKDVDPDWLAYSRAKSLQRHRFDLVIGDSIPTGKRLRVDLTRRTNDTNALIFNARLGDEVEIAYLATSAPKIDEPVVIVRGAGWEKSVRTDCTIGPSLKKEDAFGLMCMDGAFSFGPRRSRVFRC